MFSIDHALSRFITELECIGSNKTKPINTLGDRRSCGYGFHFWLGRDWNPQSLANGILHGFLFQTHRRFTGTLPIFLNHFRRLVRMIDMVKWNPSHKGPHDHITIIQGTTSWCRLNADGHDGAQWRFLPAVINAHDFFKPHHAWIGHNVIVIAPIHDTPY